VYCDVGEGTDKLSFKMHIKNHERFAFLKEWSYMEYRSMFEFQYQTVWLFPSGYCCAVATQFPYFLARSYLVLAGKVSRLQ